MARQLVERVPVAPTILEHNSHIKKSRLRTSVVSSGAGEVKSLVFLFVFPKFLSRPINPLGVVGVSGTRPFSIGRGVSSGVTGAAPTAVDGRRPLTEK